ncbi:sialate O-acetylesterase [[Clostridium] polysaccharolyticum]|uniref:Sialate O-acetylesterase n=1 Tax=[Clostridium] polysaccharolyticum TaxID=29364 RepID=A0A1I0B0M8_9FIRM|nr:sialate O-acetylesterase [[Clostridium] polysaccharolyticum]SET00233.1 sialate O-acetylesterase [[Clostridium] polysaccharolyticum]
MSKFTVAKVFSDSMVLQRQKNICVFGTGADGSKVTVALGSNKAETVIENESWKAYLPPMEAGEDYEMIITCKEEQVVFKDIAIGEVWLAGGQSNMELEAKDCAESKEILEQDKDIKVRFYFTEKNQYKDEAFYEAENNSRWHKSGSDDMKRWSAVGYLYGRKLSKKLGVTVGIIGCNWGGTSASCWVDKESLKADKDLNVYNEEYDKAVEGKTVEEQIKEFDAYQERQIEFDKQSQKVYAQRPEVSWAEIEEICGKNPWPGPMNLKSPYRPGGLYECMLQRVMPYSLRGFIYYQGESDDTKSGTYYKLLSHLIREWRKGWGDDSLPFLMVQLPMHRYEQDPDWKNWCMIRESQMKTYQMMKHTGIAVILDSGEWNEIHPKKKTPVADRLALQAFCHVYHIIDEEEAFGPVYQSCVYHKKELELKIQYAKDGLDVREGKVMFEVAGRDKKYVPADFRIQGDSIYVWADGLDNPMYARYCWSNYCDVAIFGKNGIPLAPFRTSEEDGFHVQMNLA